MRSTGSGGGTDREVPAACKNGRQSHLHRVVSYGPGSVQWDRGEVLSLHVCVQVVGRAAPCEAQD